MHIARRSNRVLMMLTLGIVVGIPATVLGQSNSLRLKVEMHQREAKERIERARRENEKIRREMKDGTSRPSQSGTSFAASELKKAVSSSSTATTTSTTPRQQPPRYDLPEGKRAAYSFVFQAHTGNQIVYIAGVAAFDFGKKDSGQMRVLAHDNLQFTSSLPSSWSPPTGSRMLKASFTVSAGGMEPDIDDVLPNLMGEPIDWFFPPLPYDVTKARGEGYTVERRSTFTSVPDWDKQNRGRFKWEVKFAGYSSMQVRLTDTRSFRSEDRSQELVGSGDFTVDQGTGLLASRNFRGTYVLSGRTTDVLLRVDRLQGE